MKILPPSTKIFFVSLVLLMASFSNVLAEDMKRIALFPFEIHSKSDVLSLQTRMKNNLTAELMETRAVSIIAEASFSKLIANRSMNRELAMTVGAAVQADFVVMGSLTRFGDSISVDVTAIDVKKRAVTSGIFAHGMGLQSVSAISRELAEKILLKILSKQRIERIEFQGNTRIEDSAVYNVLKSQEGQIFRQADLSDDIKAIYRMGYFDDVTVSVSDDVTGKVVTFLLKEKPLISSIEIEGSDHIDKEDIEETLTIRTKQVLNLEKIAADIISIKDLYSNDGYLNADVVYSVEKTGDKSVKVIFTITEHEKLYIKKISFNGNTAFTDDDLRDMMDISEKSFFHFFSDSGLLKKDKLNENINKLNAFYHNHGYINARVGEPEVTHDEEGIYIQISITEGKQFKVGKVEIVGEMLSVPRIELMEKLTINKKDYFDREAIMKDIDFLSETCNNEGYAYANVTPETISHEEEQKVDVIYTVEKGNKIYFNRISITGNTKTRDKVIRRALAVIEGELYSREKLKNSYMELNNLQYFEEVNFQTEKSTDENMTDIDIQVKEKPTGLVSLGAGYSASENAILMVQLAQRNLFGRGQTLSIDAFLGSNTTNYELSFTEPWLFDKPIWSEYKLWNMDKDYDTYHLTTQGAQATVGRKLFERVNGYVGYRYSINNVEDIDDNASSYIKRQKGEVTSSGVTFTLSRNTTNDIMFPSEGSKNSASIEQTGMIFQGDTDFTKYVASSSWFFPLPWDNVFNVRGRIGYLQENDGKEAPVYERFYLGGINSLRGLRDVGPVDPDTGDVIGGLTMAVFNCELIFPLIKDAGMKGVVFFDTGNSWLSGYELGDMRKTAGVGIRWYSPIGPLRLEWGHVLDRKENESASRWEFTVGMMI